MKFLIIIISLFIFENSSFSQNIFPVSSTNPEWKVYHSFYGMNVWTETCQYSYDTVFCGYQYSLMNINPPFMWTGHGYIRTTNDKVYVRLTNNCIDREFLMYDFNMNVGDTVICGYEDGDSTQFWLVQIDTVNYFGIDRQRYIMNFNMGIPGFSTVEWMYWIKGIGSLWHPFYSMVCLNEGCENEYGLLCYDSSAVQLYQNAALNLCDTTNMSVEENQLNESTVYFSNNSLFINSSRKNRIGLFVWDISGREVFNTASNNEQINIGELPSGIYFVMLKFRYELERIKIVISD